MAVKVAEQARSTLASKEWLNAMCVHPGRVGGHGPAGGGGDKEDAGVPGNCAQDALPAASPHAPLPGSQASLQWCPCGSPDTQTKLDTSSATFNNSKMFSIQLTGVNTSNVVIYTLN